jgi:hypothetical protein
MSRRDLAGINDIKAANRFLPAFLKRFNACFAKAAEEPGLAYRPLEPRLDLDRILTSVTSASWLGTTR